MLESDYLVVGGGAMGMAFTDVLLSETDATVTIVDRRGRPGGHWNDAYPFVRLHQPSSFYGVNSRSLGHDTKDATGWNQGLYELASGSEVVTYFDQVLHQQFLPSGRVKYLPMCRYLGARRFTSLLSGEEFEVEVKRKIVDATYMNVSVPSVRGPLYEVAPGTRCISPNELPLTESRPDGFVVVGGGKTAMDACLWLLANGVGQEDITWIIPRDSWIVDRANIQPGPEFADRAMASVAKQMEVIAESSSIDDLFAGLEAGGNLLRLDPAVKPTMYRCATVTVAELEQLKRIENVVRMGRVQRLTPHQIVFEGGSVPTTPGTVHVDCTADGLERRPVVPVFDGDHLTLQTVRTCQQVFSAAFIGHIEATYHGQAEQNDLCTVVPHPNTDIDWLRSTLATILNTSRWRKDPALASWLANARLDGFSQPRTTPRTAGSNRTHPPGRFREDTVRAIAKLREHLDAIDAHSAA